LGQRQFFASAASEGAPAGLDLISAWTSHVDNWLATLFGRALGATEGDAVGVSLVAVGGYGRAELCPHSDLDVLLLHRNRPDIVDAAERLWYPVWDERVKLGHAVRTPREALALAAEDLDTATSFLEVRHLAGDPDLTAELAGGAAEAWRKRGRRWLTRLADSVVGRHATAPEVAFHLEPDLKAGRGGLRDVQALRWATRTGLVTLDDDEAVLDEGYRSLLAVRVALHRQAGRPTDLLALQDQDAVAGELGLDADALMARVAGAGRSIAWRSDETWHRVRSRTNGSGRVLLSARRGRPIGRGLILRDDEVHLALDADPSANRALALEAGAAAAERGGRIARTSLDRLAAATPEFCDPWPDRARTALIDLLMAGPAAVGVIESLDQVGVWTRILPEWAPLRSRPQRNAYHRFTVDRHLCECAANAAALTDRVGRPDLLVLGALFHDIGKNGSDDHTEAGMALMADIGPRIGLPPEDVATVITMIRHHLLLPDVATRRDLGDEATIDAVAAAVGDLATLQLLDALTEADSLATGPAAWGHWKAKLVAELVDRTALALGDGSGRRTRPGSFPTPEQRSLLDAGTSVMLGRGDTLTLVAPDRPGLFSRVAGVLALHGLGVLAADAISSNDMALEHFRVLPPRDEPIDWAHVTADLERALSGRLAVRARLADRARTYARAERRPAATPSRVLFDNNASVGATVLEVHAPDAIGVLYRITHALAELDIDIRTAKIQTLGDTVVDAFYVRGPDGAKIADPPHLAELQRAVLHALTAG